MQNRKDCLSLWQIKVMIKETTVFNPTQIHLLKMFEIDKSEEGLEELKEVLYHYYSKKMNKALDWLWDTGQLDQKRLDDINETDLHAL